MPLIPRSLLHNIQTSLGADLSDVAIHIGPEPLHIGAAAFAHGADLYFAPGFYNPWTPAGELILVHELAHVIQQRGGRVEDAAGGVCNEELEAEANWTARRVLAGRRAWLAGRCAIHAFSSAVQCITFIQLGADEECHKWYYDKNYQYPALKELVLCAESIDVVRQFMKEFKNPPSLSYNPKTAIDSFINARKQKPQGNDQSKDEGNGKESKPTHKVGAWGNPAPVKPVQTPTGPWKVGPSSVINSPTIHSASSAEQEWDDVLPILKATVRPATVKDMKKGEVIKNSTQTIEVAVSIILAAETFKIVLHYHPDPINGNFLHFKNSAEAAINHKVNWNHWLLKGLGISGPENMTT
jgi:hypothetical protein